MDGDTGTNMSTALELFVEVSTPLKSPAETIEDLLRNAGGNSGIITAQFIAGFLAKASEAPDNGRVHFATAAAAGRDRAYASVAEPKEGTMLTVMTALADGLAASDAPFDEPTCRALCDALLETVIGTQQMLPKLREAEVVDSGALGFYLFAYGLVLAAAAEVAPSALEKIEALRSGAETVPTADIHRVVAAEYLVNVREEGHRRYCINLLIETDMASAPDDARAPHDVFADLGDSANTARQGRLLKIHLHADDAAPVRARADTLGRLVDIQIQDMHAAMLERLDEEPSQVSHKRFRVVTDSGVSLDRALAEAAGILRVDNHVYVYGRKVPDRSVNLQELYLGMRSGKVFKTAQVSPNEATRFLEEASAASERLLYIGVGNAYTGTQSGIRAAAEALPHIHCLDSRAASGQLGLICLATQRFADAAESFDDVIAYAEAQIATCKEYLVIDDLKYLAQSGRIGRITAGVASLLSLKPIVGHGSDGAITYAKVRSIPAAEKEIFARISKHQGDGPLLVMVEYTDNPTYAEALRARLAKKLPKETKIVLSPLSSASAVHMGPGTFGIAVTRIAP